MRVKLKKPIRVNCLPCEVEVTEDEFKRLLLLNAAEPAEKETTKIKKETKVVKEK